MVLRVLYEIYTIEFFKSLAMDFVSLPIYVNFAHILPSFPFLFLVYYVDCMELSFIVSRH
jgi:hypothetical protein